jgi:hypothetical protein
VVEGRFTIVQYALQIDHIKVDGKRRKDSYQAVIIKSIDMNKFD